MDRLSLFFFPFPHVLDGRRHEGFGNPWPKACQTCDRQCEKSDETDIGLCSYGINFLRVDGSLLIAGVVLSDYAGAMTHARKKAIRAMKGRTSTTEQLQAVQARARESTAQLEGRVRERMDAIVDDYRASAGYQAEIVEQLRPDIQRALAQVHDYKQFVQQIIHNMNVILAKYPGKEATDQLEHATHEEAAVYWAARLMEEKLDAALYVMYPDRIDELRDRRRFRFHGMVTKYRKIYQRRLEDKSLDLRLEGESFGDVEGNPRAIAVIPHTLIDNAIKYAPEGSPIWLQVDETSNEIRLAVSSYGPTIHPDESLKIFDLFYRGRDASKVDSEGTGFGLGSAQSIGKAIGSEISVRQDPSDSFDGLPLTVFSARFDLAPERDAPERRGRKR